MDKEEIIQEIFKLSEQDVNDVKKTLTSLERLHADRNYKSITEENKKYVGKCYKVKSHGGVFPQHYNYIKIVSERGSDCYKLSALTFPEEPLYWFNYQSSKIGRAGDYFNGRFEFYPIDIDEVTVTYLQYYEEISLEEFNQAMDKYIKELQGLVWYADHSRTCNKFPSNKDWPKERED